MLHADVLKYCLMFFTRIWSSFSCIDPEENDLLLVRYPVLVVSVSLDPPAWRPLKLSKS